MARTVSSILSHYQRRVRDWQQILGPSVIASKGLDALVRYARLFGDPDLRWIVVGDNPGDEEAADNMYFSPHGETGRSTRLVLALAAQISHLGVAFLNKVPITSSGTAGLRPYLHRRYRRIFCSMQTETAQVIYRLHQCNPEANVWIMGFGDTYAGPRYRLDHRPDLKAPPVFPFFFAELKRLYLAGPSELRDRLYITKHFSRGHFFSDVSCSKLTRSGKPLSQHLSVLAYTHNLLTQPAAQMRHT